MSQFSDCLNIRQNSSRRINVCDGDDFVAFVFEFVFDLRQRWLSTNWSLQLFYICTVYFKTLRERITKIPRDELILL